MFDEAYYKQLTRTMVLSVVLVSFTPLILISGIVGYEFHTSYRNKVIDHLEEVVEKHKQNIDSFLNERQAEIRVLANSFSFTRLRDPKELQGLLSALQGYHQGMFVDLGLIRSDGIQEAYAGPFRLGKADYSNAQWFKEVMRRKVHISDVFLGLRGVPHFIVAVRMESGERDWVLRATIDFVAFNQLVENIRIGRTGLGFIISNKGEFQTKPRVNVQNEIPAILDLIATQTTQKDVSEEIKPARNVNVSIIRPPAVERDVIIVTTPLKGGEWTLVYRQDADDALESLYHTRNLGLVVFLLGGVAIIVVAVWRSHRVVGRVRQADEEKEMLNEQFIEAGKLASVGELAAGIAHEINNPVAIMVEEGGWISDILSDDVPLSEADRTEIGQSLVQIKTQGARCKEITHKLLSFARKTDATLKAVDLNELIEEMTALSGQRARYANVQIVTNLQSDLPGICASPSEIQQVLLNLINNALDAMSKDGGQLDLSSKAIDSTVHVVVKDTGHGIPQANLARIFDPFYTTKPVGKGTGLGLSICYGIVTKMGGDITVKSTVNKGTTFTVILPQEPRAGSLGTGDDNCSETAQQCSDCKNMNNGGTS
ncbi:sensor histidine kinase [Desulfovibrio ferrophilus]|uniref:histidine kinase n=1 Tax=Desulfovibrio ferrophilus TaxID=241368 RepID=A0A2Z6B0P5_9BACT|nr:PAS domain-containing sensor histidine kinase [Desulfovibrio ferrophilus]BBD09071.1 histidine kinase [Desulfovibrio ferrophilus]